MFCSKLNCNLFHFFSYMETEKYQEAVRDYEKVCKMDRSRGKIATRQKVQLNFECIILLCLVSNVLC